MHQPIPSERSDLQEAAHAFACWRKSKPTKRARIPKHLIEMHFPEAKPYVLAGVDTDGGEALPAQRAYTIKSS